MNELSTKNFGLLIAFVLPGLTALWGASYFSETVSVWLGGAGESAPTVAGFLYLTLVSIGAGITASTVRWIVIDRLHHATGIKDPNRDFSKLQENVAAYDVIVEKHQRFYYFYSNMLVSLTFVYFARRWALGFFSLGVGLPDFGFLLIGLIFYAGSRDTLKRYYARSAQFLAAHSRAKGRRKTR